MMKIKKSKREMALIIMRSPLLAYLLIASVALAMRCTGLAHGLAPRSSPNAIAPLPPHTQLQPKKNDAIEGFLAAHNQARAAVGVGPVKWSPNLATIASRLVRYQRDHNGCKFADLATFNYGANQAWASGSSVTPRAAVEGWVKDKMFYNYADNSCAPTHDCRGYTQVVWRKSAELGCAQATCAMDGTTLTICFYDPPGNYEGERPY